jgi:hypothetical protein
VEGDAFLFKSFLLLQVLGRTRNTARVGHSEQEEGRSEQEEGKMKREREHRPICTYKREKNN